MRVPERDFPNSTSADARAAELQSLAILGAGRVGSSITRAAKAAGLDVRLVRRGESEGAFATASAALLCVGDDAIGAAAEEAATAVPPLRFVGHTSGATSLATLDPCRERGAAVFSLHPLQTIPTGDVDLGGAPCAIAGSDTAAENFARELALALGMRPFAVAEGDRAAYHAAAAIASNFLIALEESAAGLLETIGAENPRELLAPLVLRSAANWVEHGAAALTGPIARGDTATVERHRAALRDASPELLELYDALAARTEAIASRRSEAVA